METRQNKKTATPDNSQRGDASFMEHAPDSMRYFPRGDNRISPHDLFNFFTGGIIKEKTNFIR